MLTENEVISILCSHLKNQGYTILNALNTSEKGIDITADNAEHRLCIEAKGETSSKGGENPTKRYGLAFDGRQIRSHVSRAVMAAMMVLHYAAENPGIVAGIAFPDNSGHRKLVNKIIKPVKALGIIVFWVSENGSVEQV